MAKSYLLRLSQYKLRKQKNNNICCPNGVTGEEDFKMTLNKIIEMNLVKDETMVVIRNNELQLLTCGNWFQDNVLNYLDREIKSFTWQDDRRIYIDIKGE